ncbi:MFS transporter [Planosporangium thailandense]|uniref:MFS transporter n=1 Tax=Planosporangium thailandense TaxID=765197 RepID=UPI00197C0BE4|nr:MFS transporter [Planosporangium thailandense]
MRSPDPQPTRHPRRWWIHAVLSLSLFVVTLDNTVLNVAIPSLVHDLGLSSGQTQWVVDAYSLVFAGLLLTAGSLSDRYGRKRGLLVGLVLFGAGSGAAALAGTSGQLILLRGVMGVGGAFLMPGTLSILVQIFDADERPKAIGLWGAVSALGVAAGPVLGGLLVTHFWWGSVFLVNVPVVAVATVAAMVLVPESRNPHAARPDVPGALLATVGMIALVWGVIGAPEHGWTSGRVLAAGAVAVAALVAFAAWERRAPAPMLNLALLRDRRFAGASTVGALLMFALAGSTFMLTQYMQLVLGYSALAAGLRTVPVALAVGLTAPVSAQVTRKLGDGRTVAAGLFTVAAGLSVIGLLAGHESWWPVLGGGVLLGAGIGTAMAPASGALMGSLPREHAGVASALNDTVQELGAAFGVAVLGSVLAATYRSHLPRAVPDAARRSLGEALAVAPGGPGGPGLVVAARAAFDAAMHHSLLVGASVAVLGGLVGWRFIGSGRTAAGPVDAASTDTRGTDTAAGTAAAGTAAAGTAAIGTIEIGTADNADAVAGLPVG